MENFGNFFAQNCFAAASGVVLIQGTLSMYKEVTLPSIAMASIPVMVITVAVSYTHLDVYKRQQKNLNQKLIDGAISGLVDAGGDIHTSYLDNEQTESFTGSMEGSFVGIGIQFYGVDAVSYTHLSEYQPRCHNSAC